ncbi:MAG: metallopeptidase family protein [Pirellulales bacterium]
MNSRLRDIFDRQLEAVLEAAPEQVRAILDQVPLVVEDYPSDQVLKSTGVERRDELCGLYTGIPLTERSVNHSGILSDAVTLYRLGIISVARSDDGTLDQAQLREQIRITLWHELGHHVGLSEVELDEFGYG